jgi:hypothetical protein
MRRTPAKRWNYLERLLSDSEVLTNEELERVREGQAAIASGDYVTLDEWRHRLLE